jgi:peptidoglycan/LPS O-acetylase OafA/YrhL
MKPLNKVHLPFLDGIRGIAILAVFLFHSMAASFGFSTLGWVGLFRDFDVSRSFLALYPVTYGSVGVAIFFVVSGFCIHLSHQRSKEKGWLSFAIKRLFRIYPAYLLAIFVFFFVWPWGSLSLESFPRIAQLVSHVLAIHNLDPRTFFGINASFWSIAVEIQLYAIYPLFLLFTTKIGWNQALLVVGTFEICIRLWASINGFLFDERLPRFIEYSPFAFWLSWSLGAYLCECFLANRTSRLFRIRFDLMFAVAFALPFFKPTAPFTFFAFSLLTAIAIERLMTETWTLPHNRYFGWCWSHLRFLGVASYSFYLFHQPIIGLTDKVFARNIPDTSIHPLIKFSVCLVWYPLILLLSYIVYCVIEKPSIEFGRLVWTKIK